MTLYTTWVGSAVLIPGDLHNGETSNVVVVDETIHCATVLTLILRHNLHLTLSNLGFLREPGEEGGDKEEIKYYLSMFRRGGGSKQKCSHPYAWAVTLSTPVGFETKP